MLRLVIKAFKMLNSDVSPNQLSAGFIFGVFLGLTPLFNIHNVVIIFLICILRVNIAAVLLSAALFTLAAYMFDPVFNATGLYLLQNQSLLGIWQALYVSDVGQLSKFNHTLVLGSLFYALLLSAPLFFMLKILIIKYRERVLAWVQKSKAMQWLKASKWYQRAQSIHDVVAD